jgi:hypothetical protein
MTATAAPKTWQVSQEKKLTALLNCHRLAE